jgi:hypothetical protein
MSPEERKARKRAQQREWIKNHPNYNKEWWAKFYGPHRPRYLHYARKGALKSKYGLSVEEYEQMLAAQDGKCAICRNPPKKYRLAVDHNHQTGQVRKLLCSGCNGKVAAFEHELRPIIEAYLKEFS